MPEVCTIPPTSLAPAPAPAPADTPPPPTPMPENARECPIPEKNSAQPLPPPAPPPPLSPRQQAALTRLLAGEPIGDIARALQIDPKTLYRWRRHNPTFVAELTRRQRDLWLEISDDLRTTVAAGVDTLRQHLANHSAMTQLRAARFLINLVNAPRLAPTAPTTIEGVLDEMLRDRTPPPSTPEHDAQRRALLDQLVRDADA